MKNLGSCEQFTKIKLEQNLEAKIISLSQRVYIENNLEYADMLDSKLVHSLIIFRINFCKNENKPLDENFTRLYQCHVGTHMWAYVCTRPNLGFAVSIFSRFFSNSFSKYMLAV